MTLADDLARWEDIATSALARVGATEGQRELGPEMTAEGWSTFGGDSIFWLHGPSNRSVSVDGCNRENAAVPSLLDVPTDPKTPGYVVSCRQHDEHGNPIEGENVWVESYAVAIRMARVMRRSILNERPTPVAAGEQLTLDDVLAGERESRS